MKEAQNVRCLVASLNLCWKSPFTL